MKRLRFDLTDKEWSIIAPLLPTDVRGVPRVDDRRVLNGILWRKRGIWDRILDDVSKGYEGDMVMIDGSCVRVHQHGATAKRGMMTMVAWDVPGVG